MIYITQLIYIKEGARSTFEEFEARAIPIISRYNGVLELRLRTPQSVYLEGKMEYPDEIHLISFQHDEDLNAFMQDEERATFLHLKEQSIRASILVKGSRV